MTGEAVLDRACPPKEFRVCSTFIDAANYVRLLANDSENGVMTLRIENQGVFAAGLSASGAPAFDWPVLQVLAESPGNETASVFARLLIAARNEGKKEQP